MHATGKNGSSQCSTSIGYRQCVEVDVNNKAWVLGEECGIDAMSRRMSGVVWAGVVGVGVVYSPDVRLSIRGIPCLLL